MTFPMRSLRLIHFTIINSKSKRFVIIILVEYNKNIAFIDVNRMYAR